MGKKEEAPPVQEEDIPPDFIQEEDTFNFWNEDEYKGNFCANRETRNIVMEGKGIYKTSDKHIYDGVWENDLLKYANEITYPDKSKFSGKLENMIMQGPGLYQFKENIRIEGNFTNNRLIGRLHLKDPTGHYWRGESSLEDRYVIFLPLQPFWQSVLQLSGHTHRRNTTEEDHGSSASISNL